MLESKFNGFGYSAFVFSDKKSVDDDFNIVSLISVDLHAETEFFHFAVYADSEESLLTYVFKQFSVMTFTGSYYRR